MISKNEEIAGRIIEDAIKDGDLANALDKYPDITDDIREAVETAWAIKKIPGPEPDKGNIEKTLRMIMQTARTQRHAVSSGSPVRSAAFPAWRLLVPVLGAITVVVLLGWAGMLFSQKSLPGDFLYPVKMAAEQFQYVLTFQTNKKADLRVKFSGRRADELWRLFQQDKKCRSVLIDRMLSDISAALEIARSIDVRYREAVAKSIDELNHSQMQMLNVMKPLAFSGDTAIINETINKCCAINNCVHERFTLPAEGNGADLPHDCPCGDGKCDCK